MADLNPTIDMQTADTFGVSYSSRSVALNDMTWSVECFTDLADAVDFYGEQGLRAGALIAMQNGRVIGEIPTSQAGTMVADRRRELEANSAHWSRFVRGML